HRTPCGRGRADAGVRCDLTANESVALGGCACRWPDSPVATVLRGPARDPWHGLWAVEPCSRLAAHTTDPPRAARRDSKLDVSWRRDRDTGARRKRIAAPCTPGVGTAFVEPRCAHLWPCLPPGATGVARVVVNPRLGDRQFCRRRRRAYRARREVARGARCCQWR